MEEVHPNGQPPFAFKAQKQKGQNGPKLKGVHSHNDSIDRPIALRLKQAQATPDACFARGSTADIEESHVSDTTTESDVNSVFNSDGGSRRHNNDTDTSHEQDADEEQLRFAQCPVKGCTETVLADEMAYHIDLHAAIEYEQQPLGEVAFDAPIEDTSNMTTSKSPPRSGADSGLASPSLSSRFGFRNGLGQAGPSRSSSNHHHDDEHKTHRDSSAKQRKAGKEHSSFHHRNDSKTKNISSADVKHDVHREHRERRERQRSGRETLAPHSTQQTKHAATSRRPWWVVWTIRGSKKSAVAEGKTKEVEVLSQARTTPAPPKRLGKAELGKYANEERMPDKLAVYLKREWGICHRGLSMFF